MFDLRYHVASLAAVFLALIIGILVGVGISDPVDRGARSLLEEQVASLQKQLDQRSQQSAGDVRQRQAAQKYINETYPVLVRNRLRRKEIAIVFVGSADGGVRSAVSRALADAGGEQLRLRAVKVPIDGQQIDAALASQQAGSGFLGSGRVERVGRILGEELVAGGETPMWDALTDALVEERVGGSRRGADGVVVVRTVPPQRGPTSKFLLGFYSGLASARVPAVGVEATDAADSATAIFRRAGLSTVDDIDNPIGRFALVLLLAGAPSGQYGVKATAGDGALPPLPTRTAVGG
jgi:copper transport outer membrane protein MctB